MRFIIFILPAFVLCKSFIAHSQLDKESAFIGDIIKWTVEIKDRGEKQFNFPLTFEKNELISMKSYNLKYDDVDNSIIGIEFELIAWDTGKFVTPNYFIEIMKNDIVDYKFRLDPVEFEIASILNTLEQVDFRDIKGPVPVKSIFPIKQIIYCFMLFLLAIAIIFLWRKRVKPEYEKIDYDILESPADRAFRRLMEIDSSMLTKEYYSILSHVLREYLETKYFIRTLEMTTEEIESATEIFKFDKKYLAQVIRFLKESDKVKYAREIPNPEKMARDKEKIQNIISGL
ncbi:MAG: hypothetical protein CMG06_00850 [Candidatus Marinimicrobia bacterium]|nr:hypothetical protein [Candidatus Neomarinimicrobiota bacterium]